MLGCKKGKRLIVFQRGQTTGNSHHRCVNPICSTFSTLVIRPFDFNRPGACVIISIVVLNCISLMTHDIEIFFPVVILPFFYFLLCSVCSNLLPIFLLGCLSFIDSIVCILWTEVFG